MQVTDPWQGEAEVAGTETRRHRALADESRVRLLRILQTSDQPLGTAELASQIGLHLTTVRAHLTVLADAGLVTSEAEQRRTPGRPRVLYRAAGEAATSEGLDGYRLLTEILSSHLAGTTSDPAEQAVAAGRAWGEYLVERPPPFANPGAREAREHAVGLLDSLGFEPELDGPGDRILLRRCPFLEVARRHPDVVCSVHLGLLQGALGAFGSQVTVRGLEPFVEPSLCVAHIADTTI